MSADGPTAPHLPSRKRQLASPFSLRASAVTVAAVLAIQLVLFWPVVQDRRHHYYSFEQSVDLGAKNIPRSTDDTQGLAFARQMLEIRDVLGVEVTNAIDGGSSVLGMGQPPADVADTGHHPIIEQSYWYVVPAELIPAGISLKVHLTATTVQNRTISFVVEYLLICLGILLSLASLTIIFTEKYMLRPMMALQRALSDPGDNVVSELRGLANQHRDEIGDVFRTTADLLKQNAEFRENMGQLVLERTLELTNLNSRLRTIESQTRSKEKRIRAILDNSPSFIYLKDTDGRYLLVNKQVEDSLGVSAENIIGKTHRDFYSEDLTETYANQDREVIAQRKPVAMEALVPRADGPPRASIIYKFPVLGPIGEVESIGAVIVDIEDRVQAEREMKAAKDWAEQASKSKSDLIANVSHEVRTPMNGVLGMARLLQGTDLDDGQRETLETVISSAEALLRIVNDLLDISKLEAEQLELEDIPFLSHDLVSQSVKVLAGPARDKNLTLVTEVDDTVPEVLGGDPYRLRQVLMNLVSNAVKFTSQGEIKVTLSARPENTYRFEVSDTGAGIAPDVQEQLFSPFAQGASDVARKYGGTGLGLTICRRLVNLMGGQVELDSEVGRGSSFSFEIPLHDCPDVDPESLRAVSRHGADAQFAEATRKLKVLQVEDNPVNQNLVERLLSKAGHETVTAENGLSALEYLEQESFDIVIMDKHMPRLDGLETTRRIRALSSANSTVPILGVTAGALEFEQTACLEAGMGVVLTKPIEEGAFFTAIAQLTALERRERLPVLVVDDVEINLHVARKQLENLGVACESTSDPAAALEMMKEDRFSAVLVDKEMPDFDGVQLTRKFREWENGRTQELPIIGVSGHLSKEDRDECIAAGMTAYLTKPVKIQDLEAALVSIKVM